MNSIITEFRKSKSLKGKRILIIGFGVTGQSLKNFCDHFGGEVFVTDHKEIESPFFLTLSELTDYDLALKSPGVPWTDPAVKYCMEKKIEISGDIDLVSQIVEAPIIAITGTNGKSTVVKMISETLDLMNIPHFLGGNYGIAFSEIIKQSKPNLIILELSSFQLELMKHSRIQYGLITNLHAHHLERYDCADDYFYAKYKLKKLSQSIYAGEVLEFFPEIPSVEFDKKIDWSKMVVKGEHNKMNFQMCFHCLEKIEIQNIPYEKMLCNYKGLEHRLEQCSLNVFNDSKSTSIDATLTALKSFSKQELKTLRLIIGGKLRTKNVSEFKNILNYIHEDQIFLFGESRNALKQIFPSAFITEQLEQIELDSSKGVILFSPGFPSFDQFKNFMHRGDVFKSLFK